jgi:hypothetical protein
MGWGSGGDPMHSTKGMLKFPTSAAAVEFCKKRGWKYDVEQSIEEAGGRAQEEDFGVNKYENNFFSEFVKAKVKKGGRAKCDHFSRTASGASHYFRPLTFHGEKEVPQYGPTGDAPIAPDVQGEYKKR